MYIWQLLGLLKSVFCTLAHMLIYAHAAVTLLLLLFLKVAQLCLTLCDPMDDTVHGILQARTLEWVAFCFSRGSSQPRDQTQVYCIAGGFFTI